MSWRSSIARLQAREIRRDGARASTAGNHREAQACHAARLTARARQQWAADGSAREYGFAGRLAAAGRRWPRPRAGSMPAILGLLGMTLIGAGSLWRAYRTTVGLYSGQSTNVKGRPAPAPAVASPASVAKPGGLWLEARLPGLSEPVSAIALGGFRSLVRSPEAKMMLLSPVIMIPIFGSMLWRGRAGYSGVAPAARRHRRDGPRALRRGAIDGQSIRLRPRRLSRVRAVSSVSAGHSAGQEPGLRPAGFGVCC